MELSRLTKILRKNGDKFIVVEKGEPQLVVMSFREYEKLTGDGVENHLPETEFVMSVLGEDESRRPEEKPVRLEEITLDDLPL